MTTDAIEERPSRATAPTSRQLPKTTLAARLAHILERQHCDRWLIGERQRRRDRGRPGRLRAGSPRSDTIHLNGPRNVLVFLRLCSPMSRCRRRRGRGGQPLPREHGQTRRCRGLGQAFEAGGDVDAVAKDVVLLDDDVTLMDADAKLDVTVTPCGSARGTGRSADPRSIA
jgi:hypothetical protein